MAVFLLSAPLIEALVQLIYNTCGLPLSEVVVDDLPACAPVGQLPPLAARSKQVEQQVTDQAHIVLPLALICHYCF
jgi:hypothetical protein